MEDKKLNENDLQEEVYISKVPYIRLALIALAVAFTAFFINFPIKEKIKGSIIGALKSNRTCKVNYSKLDLDLFFQPTLNFKNMNLPGRCFGSRGAGLSFDTVDLVLKRPTVIPPGVLFHARAKESITDLNIFATMGIGSTIIRIENSVIDGSLIATAAKLPVKLKGSLSVDALIESDYKVPTGGSFHITSKNLSLPPQRVIILDIKGLSLAPMIFKGTLDKGVVNLQRFQLGNSTTKLEAIFADGTIKLDMKNPRRHMVDLEGRIRLSPELLKEFPIIAPFLGNANLDSNGYYRIQLKGPVSSLKPKFL